MRSQYGGKDGQRHENPQARPKRLRDEDGDDDEPVYIDAESNETVSRQDYQALSDGKQDQLASKEQPHEKLTAGDHAEHPSGEEQRPKAPSGKDVAGIGLKKKTKKVRAIGEDVDEIDLDGEKQEVDETAKSTKPKRKKKIKLSFDQGE